MIGIEIPILLKQRLSVLITLIDHRACSEQSVHVELVGRIPLLVNKRYMRCSAFVVQADGITCLVVTSYLGMVDRVGSNLPAFLVACGEMIHWTMDTTLRLSVTMVEKSALLEVPCRKGLVDWRLDLDLKK